MSRNSKSQKGFTLIEMTISLFILVIVLVLSMSLLFSMKNFAQRQRQFAEPRQNARRAVDYLGGFIRSATDMNFASGNPNCIVASYSLGGTVKQSTQNDVQNAALAEQGTDIITVGTAPTYTPVEVTNIDNTGTQWTLNFSNFCTGATQNMKLLMDATGDCSTTCGGGTSNCSCLSDLLSAYNMDTGQWNFVQISKYKVSTCNPPNSSITVDMSLNTASNGGDNSGVVTATSSSHAMLSAGLRYLSFRVRQDPNDATTLQLQQKQGMFDPAVDNPGNNFFGILDNIEDMQLAYIYNDGTVVNNVAPTQANIANLIGIRLSVTARANTPVSLAERAKFLRPASEDRPAADDFDRFYHYRLTSTIMIRNRSLGG
jgi:prepilin-type N-terminal cleavage/methylation domain-containing protein